MIFPQSADSIECFAQYAQLPPAFFLYRQQAEIAPISSYLVYCPETNTSVLPVLAIENTEEKRDFVQNLLGRMYTVVNWLEEKGYINITDKHIAPEIPNIEGKKTLFLVFSDNLPENTLAKTLYTKQQECVQPPIVFISINSSRPESFEEALAHELTHAALPFYEINQRGANNFELIASLVGIETAVSLTENPRNPADHTHKAHTLNPYLEEYAKASAAPAFIAFDMLNIDIRDFIQAVEYVLMEEQSNPESSFCPYKMKKEEARRYRIYEKALDIATQGAWREFFTDPKSAEFDKFLAVAYAHAVNNDLQPSTRSAQLSAEGILRIPSFYLVHQDAETRHYLQIGEDQETQGITLERGFFLNLKVINASGEEMRLSIKDSKGKDIEGFFVIKDQQGAYQTSQGNFALIEGKTASVFWMSTNQIPNTNQLSIQLENYKDPTQRLLQKGNIFAQ